MNKYENLLISWCDYLIERQTEQAKGGFSCEACEHIHGRADNAIFPLVCAYSITKNDKYLKGAEKLLPFRKLLTDTDGAVHNDFISEWKGITSFSAINLFKTLYYYGNILPADFKADLEVCFDLSAKWVHDNIKTGFRANINYYAASAAVNAMYGEYRHDTEYTDSAKQLLEYCLSHFTDNGLLTGEGQPHAFRTEKGCAPVDIGYNIEESVPCLVDAAHILNDNKALPEISRQTEKLLDFILPDGGWDNSFGSRNTKWTYYGSRTSDGCIGAFTILGKYNDIFYEAAERTFNILDVFTHKGRLYGGKYYIENNVPPCIHHTFSHACALADAIVNDIKEPEKRKELPCDREELSYKYYPEIDTYKIHAGKWLATVTANDYATYTFTRGAAHASGGALSMLFHKDKGAVIAGSVFEYKLTEVNNMQTPPEGIVHSSLIPRAEYKKDGIIYSTALDGNAVMSISQTADEITLKVTAKFVNVNERKAEDDDLTADFTYRFTYDKIFIYIIYNKNKDIKFYLPIIKNTAKVITDDEYTARDTFFLTPGYNAEEYTFTGNTKIVIN